MQVALVLIQVYVKLHQLDIGQEWTTEQYKQLTLSLGREIFGNRDNEKKIVDKGTTNSDTENDK